MCKQEFKWQKLLKIYLEVKIYRLIIYLIFIFSGYEGFTIKNFLEMIFEVAHNFGKSFTSSFLAFYILIPFINKLITMINKKEHERLIICLVIIFSIIPTLFVNTFYEYISWYITLYLIAAYLRNYPTRVFDSITITGIASVTNLLLSSLSVGVIFYASDYLNKTMPYYWFVIDSNKILALTTSVFVFSFFKNITIKQNLIINKLASTTFAVLLIHSSSDTMRKWLWQDICKNLYHFENDSLFRFLLHAITCTILVFFVCSIIDLIRQLFQRKIVNIILRLKQKN